MPRLFSEHVFHTKHDFSPELGWAAFQLLAQAQDEAQPHKSADLSVEELEELAEAVASPLAARSDGQKVVAGLADVGLVEREKGRARLSTVGRLTAQSMGRYEDGFRKVVHALYFWRWVWMAADDAKAPANPSWSFRAVCQHILEAGPSGIERDDLVLRVVEDAGVFDAPKVSFSRSSVSGVTSWLEAQRPPMIGRHGHAIVAQSVVASESASPTPGAWRLHLAALCGLHGGEVVLNASTLGLLAQALLLSPSALPLPIAAFCDGGEEFLFIRSAPPRIVFRGSSDGLIRWMAQDKTEKSLKDFALPKGDEVSENLASSPATAL